MSETTFNWQDVTNSLLFWTSMVFFAAAYVR